MPLSYRSWTRIPSLVRFGLAGYLAGNAVWLTLISDVQTNTIVAAFFGSRGTGCVFPRHYYLAPQPDGTWTELLNTTWRAAADQHAGIVVVTRSHRAFDEGIWSPVVHSDVVTARFFLADTDRDVVDPSVRLALLQAVNNSNPGVFSPGTHAALVSGELEQRTILWWGVRNDATVVAAVGGLFSTLRWRRRIERRWDDRCKGCGYPFAGLPTAVCPECGADLAALPLAES